MALLAVSFHVALGCTEKVAEKDPRFEVLESFEGLEIAVEEAENPEPGSEGKLYYSQIPMSLDLAASKVEEWAKAKPNYTFVRKSVRAYVIKKEEGKTAMVVIIESRDESSTWMKFHLYGD